MARRPEVFVRSLSTAEGSKFQQISRTAKDPVKLRRTIVVLMSAQGQSVPDITSLLQVSDDYVPIPARPQHRPRSVTRASRGDAKPLYRPAESATTPR